MPVLWNPESEYHKEMRKWDQPNYNPANHPYPKMLYKAHRTANGKWATFEPRPFARDFYEDKDWERACAQADQFSSQCQRIVNGEEEHGKARDEGWMDTQSEAVQHQMDLQKMISTAAAERAYQDKNMGEGAKAEVKAAEESHFGHMPEIPERKIRRRGRKPKVA